jgi:TrmH family RNA methyltransferase
MVMLLSPQNPKIKLVRQLQQKKFRDKEKKFVVEGIHLVEEIIKTTPNSQLPTPKIEYIVYSEGLKDKKVIKKLLDLEIECYEVGDKVMDSLAQTETPQGILAVVQKPEYRIEDVLTEDALIVICIGISDPGNLGTIIRTADAVGASGVLLSENCVDLYNDKVIRATQGAIFHLPVVEGKISETVKRLNGKTIKIVAAVLGVKKDYREIKYKLPVAVMIGSESRGIPQDILALTDEQVKIPIYGQAESLNAAVAAGVILYEIVRQVK